ncbi:phospholipase A and acyltransferase 4-like [Alosa pseudoharengus]|uniref:phospholipase A and acyltransferase 4-like n=1 Tax=Alosa pseudoharengus TaxID=34774 RepID=UPI003F8CDE6E
MCDTLCLNAQNPGDLIEIQRGMYNHWALYVGNDEVIDFTSDNPGGISGVSASISGSVSASSTAEDNVSNSGMGTVRRQKLKDVVADDEWSVNNYLDGNIDVKPIRTILEKANEQVGERKKYSLNDYNCEHFVTKLRNGIAVSRQVATTIEIAKGLMLVISIIAKCAFGDKKRRRNNDNHSNEEGS